MQWVIWLDKHPGAAMALPTILLVIVTAWLGVMTWLNARRTKELVRLQFFTTFLDFTRPLPDPIAGMKGKVFDEQQWHEDAERLLCGAFPGFWEQMRKMLRGTHQARET